MSKLLIISGTHNRHLHISLNLKKKFRENFTLFVKREDPFPEAPLHLNKKDYLNYAHHFNQRNKLEKKFFGSLEKYITNSINQRIISKAEVNSNITRNFILDYAPDFCLVFGSCLLNKNILSVLPYYTFNLHLGLSPRYRGSATLFWPFYFLEPQFAGCTIHKIDNYIDSGNIYHQFTI